jgi:hypothetical protein
MFIALALVVMSSTYQTKKKGHQSRYDTLDGGYVMREECLQQTDKCWEDCFTRNASIVCGGCCREQFFLCNIHEKYSFEHCKTAE